MTAGVAKPPRALAEIDLSAISQNITLIRGLVSSDCLFMAVVKANGYGHGAVEVARIAIEAGASRFGVATVDEARELRDAGIGLPIHLLGSFFPYETERMVELELIPTVFTLEGVEAVDQASKKIGKVTNIHIKVDTGMSRIGAYGADAAHLVKSALERPNLFVEGVMTHFACADMPEDTATREQLDRFNSFMGDLDSLGIEIPLKHAANSAATFLFPESHFDMVRIGIAMYGLSPFGLVDEPEFLKPALSLKSSIALVKKIERGTGVSYGRTFISPETGYLATLPMGYADGYSRLHSNVSSVLIGSNKYSISGNVCMDQMTVFLGSNEASIGDEVVLIGRQGGESISAEELASNIGTINYEIVCTISSRVERIYIGR